MIPARPDLIGWGNGVELGALFIGLWAGFRGQWKGEAAYYLDQPALPLRFCSNPNTFDQYLQDLRAICIYPVRGWPVLQPSSSCLWRDRVRGWLGQKWSSFGTVAILGLLLTGSWFSIRRAEAVAYYTEARHAL